MNGKCFEIGTIQAFLDGETTPDVSMRLTAHVADCDRCALLMATAEEESSVVFSTLERELNSLVPTQRLWTRINETIAVEQGQTSVWQKAFAFIRASLASPSLVAAAGIILVLGMFAAIVNVRDNDGGFIADRTLESTSIDGLNQGVVDIATTGSDSTIGTSAANPPTVAISKLSQNELNSLAIQANARGGQKQITPQRAVYNPDAYIPGEEGYIKTISDLRQNVEEQKDTVLTPSTRVSYERDMAVVDESIKRMRDVVRKNPKNQAARQVLYSSYQDKIDLLNSVAQREELMAALR